MEIIQPDDWSSPSGYANGVVAQGRLLFVAGQVGWDATKSPPVFAQGFVAQFDLTLANVCTVISRAGGKPENLAKLTLYVTDKKQYLAHVREVGAAWRKHFGRHFPAMALLEVKGLLADEALVEMEAIAVL